VHSQAVASIPLLCDPILWQVTLRSCVMELSINSYYCSTSTFTFTYARDVMMWSVCM